MTKLLVTARLIFGCMMTLQSANLANAQVSNYNGSVFCISDEATLFDLVSGDVDEEYTEQPSSFTILSSGELTSVSAPFCQFVSQINRSEDRFSFNCLTMEPDSEAMITVNFDTLEFSKFIHIREKAIVTMNGVCSLS
jgi:hypothetical protein